MLTFAARWTTASWPATAAQDGVGVGDVGQHLAQAEPGGAALQDGDVVPARGQGPGGRAAEHPAGSRDEDPHVRPSRAARRPAAARPTGPAGRGRPWRRAGCRPAARRRRAPPPAGRATPPGPRRPAPARPADAGGRRPSAGTTTATTCWVPTGPTPTAAAARTSSSVSIRCSTPTGVTGPSAVVTTCTSRPSTQSRPSSSRWPTSPLRWWPGSRELWLLGRPQPVVALLAVRGGDADLAAHARLVGQRAVGPAQLVQRADPDRHPGQRPADADAVALAGRLDLRQGDVGGRQHLGHPVRRVQLGLRQQRLHLPQQPERHRGPGGQQGLHAAEGVAPSVVELARRGHDVAQRGRARRRPRWRRRPAPRRPGPSRSGSPGAVTSMSGTAAPIPMAGP